MNIETELKERVLYFFNQITRCNDLELEKQSIILRNLLIDIKNNGNNKEIINILYKIIGYTRDIIDGPGEYLHSYMQILVWYDYYPEFALSVLRNFVFIKNIHPYGSWKDIKNFCQYCNEKRLNYNHPLIKFCISLINNQIYIDNLPTTKIYNKSLAAKWVPREKSKKKGWIFEKLAFSYFHKYFDNVKTIESRNKAELKCKMNYRKLISKLNKEIDTVQIKQCSGNWQSIDFSKTTSLTIYNQTNSFLNINQINTPDRINCSKNFKEHINKVINSAEELKTQNVGINQLVKRAFELILMKNDNRNNNNNYKTEIDLLNLQWKNKISKNLHLKPIIPIIDLSRPANMYCDDIYSAIGIGCIIAEKSSFGKRILSFSDNPCWHNLEECDNFVEIIEKFDNPYSKNVDSKEQGITLPIEYAIKLLLYSIIESGLTTEEVENLTLAIFTDNYNEGLINNINTMFKEEGLKFCGKPYVRPHILLWNLKSNVLMPCSSSESNVSMISGFNPKLLNLFSENYKGVEQCFEEKIIVPTLTTPWDFLLKTLSNPRYESLSLSHFLF